MAFGKKIYVLAVLLGLFCCPAVATASPSYLFNGVPWQTIFPLIISEGQTMAVTDDVAAVLRLNETYDADGEKVVLSNDKYVLEFTLGDYSAVVNGDKILLNTAPRMVDGNIYVPVKAAVEGAGGIVAYDQASSTVKLSLPDHRIVIYCAGDLDAPLAKMAEAYHKLHSDTEFVREKSGSIDAIKKVTQIGMRADIVASTDYLPIESYMIPSSAAWDLRVAGSKMVLVYNDKSRFAPEINSNNWYKVLASNDVRIGSADPNSDPVGYRTNMVMQLAGNYYNDLELPKNLVGKVKIVSNYYDDLKAGKIDYAFSYISSARQNASNGVKYIELPDAVNLGSDSMTAEYSKVRITADGKEVMAVPIAYGLTVPKSSLEPQAAYDFIKYMASEEGRKFITDDGLIDINPYECNDPSKLPAKLQEIVQ